MSSFVVVLPLTPLRVGDGFSLSAWPLHVTVAQNFATALDAEAIGRLLADALGDTPVIDITIGDEALFGRLENVPVALVEPSPRLRTLHDDLRSALDERGAVLFENPEFGGDGYRPHVTATKREHARSGERFALSTIALVDMAPAGDERHRRVVWTATLPA